MDLYGGCPHGLAGRPYCGTCSSEDKARSDELEDLREENRQLKFKLRRALENVRSLETELDDERRYGYEPVAPVSDGEQ